MQKFLTELAALIAGTDPSTAPELTKKAKGEELVLGPMSDAIKIHWATYCASLTALNAQYEALTPRAKQIVAGEAKCQAEGDPDEAAIIAFRIAEGRHKIVELVHWQAVKEAYPKAAYFMNGELTLRPGFQVTVSPPEKKRTRPRVVFVPSSMMGSGLPFGLEHALLRSIFGDPDNLFSGECDKCPLNGDRE